MAQALYKDELLRHRMQGNKFRVSADKFVHGLHDTRTTRYTIVVNDDDASDNKPLGNEIKGKHGWSIEINVQMSEVKSQAINLIRAILKASSIKMDV